jgi:hypothetical protein
MIVYKIPKLTYIFEYLLETKLYKLISVLEVDRPQIRYTCQ